MCAAHPTNRMGNRSAAARERRENGTLEVGGERAERACWRAGVRVKAGHRRVAGNREAVAVAVRGVPEPALCGYNGEDPNRRRSQGLYSDRRVDS
jgi:hypothetical protein